MTTFNLNISGIITSHSTRYTGGGAYSDISLDGALTPEGVFVKSLDKQLLSTISTLGSLTKLINLTTLSGFLTPLKLLSKSFPLSFSGFITPESVLNAVLMTGVYYLNLFGFISLHSTRWDAGTGASYNISFDGYLTPSGSIIKDIWLFLLGFITPDASGLTEIIKNYILGLTGEITPAGNFVKSTFKTLQGVISSTGDFVTEALIKMYNLAVSGIITPFSSLVKSVTKTFESEVFYTRSFSRSISFLRSFIGSITPTGAISTLTAKLLSISGSILTSGLLSKSISRNISSTINSIGAVSKSTLRYIFGTLIPSALTTVLRGTTPPADNALATITLTEVTVLSTMLEYAHNINVNNNPTCLVGISTAVVSL